ncbi:hypothetical protein PENTCL1PPCAC_16162, partial [Pristionchus entomophagus]
NPKYTVIMGWPCLSKKRCKTCIMFAEPTSINDWPCQYSGYEQCTSLNNRVGTTSFKCDQFFDQFDFIPIGVNIPNITNWATGSSPYNSACTKINNTASPALRSTCW